MADQKEILENGTQDTVTARSQEDIETTGASEHAEGDASGQAAAQSAPDVEDAGEEFAEELPGSADEGSSEGEEYEIVIGDRVERYTAEEMGELLAAAQEVVELADKIRESYEELARLREENRKYRELLEQQAQQAQAIVQLVQRDPILDAVLFWRRQGYDTDTIIDGLLEYRDKLVQREKEIMGETSEVREQQANEPQDALKALQQKVRELEVKEIVEHNRQVGLQVLQELQATDYLKDEEFLRIVDQVQQEIYPNLNALEHRFTPRQMRAILQEAIAEYKRRKGAGQPAAPAKKAPVAVKRNVKLPQQAPGNAGAVPQRNTPPAPASLITTLSQRQKKYYEL